MSIFAPKVRCDGNGCTISLWFLANVRFWPEDVGSIEEIERTRYAAGFGVHWWAGRWTMNSRVRPAVRITFTTPARMRILVFPVRVRQLDVAPATRDDFVAAGAIA